MGSDQKFGLDVDNVQDAVAAIVSAPTVIDKRAQDTIKRLSAEN